MVQVSSGLCLLGITVQYLFFHYGDGANDKSVYRKRCAAARRSRLTLPATSLIGEGGASAAPAPTLRASSASGAARQGTSRRRGPARKPREGADRRETITARDLFAGYFDFPPLFIAMMSGNGYPRISGVDDGIWRRMAVIHCRSRLPRKTGASSEEVVSSFDGERSGILNWFDRGRAHLPQGRDRDTGCGAQATQDYRDDMDRTAGLWRGASSRMISGASGGASALPGLCG